LANLAARYAGLYASYEITPLLKWMTYVALSGDDRALGMQSFSGAAGSEFASLSNALHVQLQWFFKSP
jgi:hypothetical protein